MLFNSIEFVVFLPIVFVIYWVLNKELQLQNLFLVASSYFFYGWWDWRFLSLIVISSIIDYSLANKIYQTDNNKEQKICLYLSLLINLGFLGFFKYFNFFVDSFTVAFSFFGQTINGRSLNIILPVGISFYTFQTLSYTIDVYRKKLKPTTDIISFFAFVSFFPQLVAGPIERATNLLPQFYKQRKLLYQNIRFGIYLIVFGLFKKMIIGDNISSIADKGFSEPNLYSSSTLLLIAFLFSIQIYVDFSGYTDIARGTARLFGFRIMENFRFPYFTSSIGKFWRHWHISLSTWFRDYVYIPLGGSRISKFMTNRNLLIVFVTSGLWHGANWTFIIWGLIHGLVLVFENIFKTASWFLSKNKFVVFSRIIYVNIIVIICWVFFRAPSVQLAFDYLESMFILKSSQFNIFNQFDTYTLLTNFIAIIILFISDIYYQNKTILQIYRNRTIPYLLFSTYLFLLVFAYQDSDNTFIYFQF